MGCIADHVNRQGGRFDQPLQRSVRGVAGMRRNHRGDRLAVLRFGFLRAAFPPRNRGLRNLEKFGGVALLDLVQATKAAQRPAYGYVVKHTPIITEKPFSSTARPCTRCHYSRSAFMPTDWLDRIRPDRLVNFQNMPRQGRGAYQLRL